MANDNETVREVCDLIRIPRLDLFKTYDELADRILSAHEREMAAKDAEIKRMHDCCDALEDEFDRKDAEMTAEQKRRVIDALVKAASMEMVHINEEVK